MGPMGAPWAPWGPWGPYGAPWGPMGPLGGPQRVSPIIPLFPGGYTLKGILGSADHRRRSAIGYNIIQPYLRDQYTERLLQQAPEDL